MFGSRSRRHSSPPWLILASAATEVAAGRGQLATLLSDLRLDLHDADSGKDFELVAGDWLEGEADCCGNDSQGWMFFARDLKLFPISQTSSRAKLPTIFAEEGFRIPLPDYSVEVSGARYQDRFLNELWRYPWLLSKILKQATPSMLLLSAQTLRAR